MLHLLLNLRAVEKQKCKLHQGTITSHVWFIKILFKSAAKQQNCQKYCVLSPNKPVVIVLNAAPVAEGILLAESEVPDVELLIKCM